MQFSFLYPSALLLLLALPCFIVCKIKVKEVYFSKPEWLPKSRLSWDNLLLWTMLIYALMVVTLASPFSYSTQSNQHKKGRDLVLLLDTSGSMAEGGFNGTNQAQSKYEISVELAKAFIEKRYDDNVGLVVFGTFAFTASPLTYDLKVLNEMFELMSDVGIAGTSTAIGDAIVQGLRTVEVGEAKSKVLILLTDGMHNAGKYAPREAVAMAQERGVKVYTIGIGKKKNHDVALLETIAKETGAKNFFCENSRALEKVYEEIAKLEPSPIRSEAYMNKNLLSVYPLALAILLLTLLLMRYEERL